MGGVVDAEQWVRCTRRPTHRGCDTQRPAGEAVGACGWCARALPPCHAALSQVPLRPVRPQYNAVVNREVAQL